ncbi:MAG: acetyl-CoA carboxylase biotin carboxyl carrier protein [Phycisphaeraceae bacterium]
MDLKTLKQLVKLMADQDLTELDLEDEKGEKVRLRRRGGQPEVQYVSAPQAAPAPPVPTPAPAVAAAASDGNGAPAEAASTGVTIDSPMVGTFYAASSPDADAFVSVGSRVEPDTVVCIIEAMKVFNEIKAERAGTIKKILVENGQAVEFGQPLFEIEPA